MDLLISYLKENSSWIRDIGTLILTGTATVLAILTYRRAKATVLQPKRTEVIKIQSQVLVDFLKSISDNGNSIDSSLDYMGVFNCNFFYTIWKTTPSSQQDPEIYEMMNKSIGGWYARNEEDPTNLMQIKGDLDDLLFYMEHNKVLSLVVLTSRAIEAINRIRALNVNPFIPDKINVVLDQIMKDMGENYFVVMPTLLTDEVIKQKDVKVLDLMRAFEKKRKHHVEAVEKLKEKIREHLGVNEKW